MNHQAEQQLDDAMDVIDSAVAEQTEQTEQREQTEQIEQQQQPTKCGGAFELRSWNPVAMWTWAVCADTCAICRNALTAPSIEYQSGNATAGDFGGVTAAFGACSHAYHLDCVQRWLKTRTVCPLCNDPWDIARMERIPGYDNDSALA